MNVSQSSEIPQRDVGFPQFRFWANKKSQCFPSIVGYLGWAHGPADFLRHGDLFVRVFYMSSSRQPKFIVVQVVSFRHFLRLSYLMMTHHSWPEIYAIEYALELRYRQISTGRQSRTNSLKPQFPSKKLQDTNKQEAVAIPGFSRIRRANG